VGKIGDNGVQDVSKIIPCISFEEWPAATGNAQGLCKYSSPSELRYILTF
jgi:hypothetical protein